MNAVDIAKFCNQFIEIIVYTLMVAPSWLGSSTILIGLLRSSKIFTDFSVSEMSMDLVGSSGRDLRVCT